MAGDVGATRWSCCRVESEVSGFQRLALKTLVVENSRASKPASVNEVWNLNLDQIESDTGRVLAKQMVSTAKLGPSTYPFEAGTVLYSKLRPYLNKVVVADDAGVATTELVPLRCNPEKLLPQYLAYFLRSPEFQQFANVVVAGAKMPRMVMGEFWDYKIPVPPLPEQRRIAAILDQADALRAKRREALAQLDSLTQSIFIELFGDPVANPKRWARTPIQEVCGSADDIKCGPFGTQLSKSEVTEEGVPLWGIKNVNTAFRLPAFEFLQSSTANRLKAYDLIVGDIVMTRKGTIGNCAVYPDDFPNGIMHSDLLRIRTDFKKCLPSFLSHQLHHSKDVERQLALISGGAVMPGINVTKLKSIEVLVPPTEQQQMFVERSAAVDVIRRREEQALNVTNSLFASLQHRAFRGEL
jgi:type I restriction enzyme, S subunit